MILDIFQSVNLNIQTNAEKSADFSLFKNFPFLNVKSTTDCWIKINLNNYYKLKSLNLNFENNDVGYFNIYHSKDSYNWVQTTDNQSIIKSVKHEFVEDYVKYIFIDFKGISDINLISLSSNFTVDDEYKKEFQKYNLIAIKNILPNPLKGTKMEEYFFNFFDIINGRV